MVGHSTCNRFSSIKQKGLISVQNTNTNSFDLVRKEVNAEAFNARLNSNFKTKPFLIGFL
jgi:hypothetical protein